MQEQKSSEDTKQKVEVLNKKIEALKDEIATLKPDDENLMTLQLQYAFYQKSVNLYNKKLLQDKNDSKAVEELMADSIKNIQIQKSKIEQDMNKTDANISKINKEIEKANINLERLNLLNKDSKNLEKHIQSLNKKASALKRDKIVDTTLLYIDALKGKNSKEVFKLEDSLRKQAKKSLTKFQLDGINAFANIADKKYLGNLAVIKGQASQEFKNTLALFLLHLRYSGLIYLRLLLLQVHYL